VAEPVDRPVLPPPSAQLLLYRLAPDAEFEGQLVGALQRTGSGGTRRVLDASFVRGDVAAVLIEHGWATALEDAVARIAGTPVASEFVDATSLAELSAEDA
jgi:hypothetical protein